MFVCEFSEITTFDAYFLVEEGGIDLGMSKIAPFFFFFFFRTSNGFPQIPSKKG